MDTVAGGGSQVVSFPRAVTVDSAGTLYVSDDGGIRSLAKGASKILASVSASDLKVDSAGNLYYSTPTSIHKIDRSGKDTVIISGNFATSYIPVAAIPDVGIAFDPEGTLYYTDFRHDAVMKIGPDGKERMVVGVAGPVSVAIDAAGTLYVSGTRSGGGSQIFVIKGGKPVSLVPKGVDFLPWQAASIVVDSAGMLYVADFNHSSIRRIDPVNLAMTTIAGQPSALPGFAGDGGKAANALLADPLGLAIDSTGNIYIADYSNGRIRRVDPAGNISTVAGAGHLGTGNEAATAIALHYPNAVAADPAGNLYIADMGAHVVRKVTSDGKIRTIAGTGACAAKPGPERADEAPLCSPSGVAVDAIGNVFVAGSARVWKIDTSGMLAVIAGTGYPADAGDEGPAVRASLLTATSVAVDADGRVYVTDSASNRVRVITADGKIHAFAGNASRGFSGDGGPAAEAQLSFPDYLAIDRSGVLYISDIGNNRIRKVSSGVITTAVNTAAFGNLAGVAVDAVGNVFFAGSGKSAVLRADAAGNIASVAGGNGPGFGGDGESAPRALFNMPHGLAAGRSGMIYVADFGNLRVRALAPNPPVQLSILAGDAQTGIAGMPLAAPLRVSVRFALRPMAGLPVSFAVASGTAALSSQTALTDSSGIAEVALTLGAAVGPISVSAAVAGLPPVFFRATAAEDTRPSITPGGVFGAAGSSPPVRVLSPGGLATIVGRKLAPPGVARILQSPDLQDGALPTALSGTCVEVAGVRAYLLYVSDSQINFQAPVLVSSPAGVQVITDCGTSREQRSNVERISIQSATPEFLYWTHAESGRNPVVAVNVLTGQYIGPAGLMAGAAFVAAKPGDTLTIYGISFGATMPETLPGRGASAASPLAGPYSVALGGSPVPAAAVLYVGATPGSPGLYQLNLRVPEDAPDGDLPLTLNVDNFVTVSGAYVTIHR